MQNPKVQKTVASVLSVCTASTVLTAFQLLLAYVRYGNEGLADALPQVLYPAGMLVSAGIVLLLFRETDRPVSVQFAAGAGVYAIATIACVVTALRFPLGSDARGTLSDMSYTSGALVATCLLMLAGIKAVDYVRTRLDAAAGAEHHENERK